MKLRFPPNQIFGKARIPAVQPIILDVYKVGQDPITRLTMPTPSRNLKADTNSTLNLLRQFFDVPANSTRIKILRILRIMQESGTLQGCKGDGDWFQFRKEMEVTSA